ncbi:MAG: hypothetical protein OXN80_07070 [bacterium]|nr:hypothetical protein [bacterium]MDE0188845.1 hypothetical protein [bacterium]MDE0502104.1 hypothetical protein [bacterium]
MSHVEDALEGGMTMRDVEMASPGREVVDRRLPTMSKEETARLGREIYQRDIRPQVEADHFREVVAIDLDTGIWAMGHDLVEAVEGLREQSPDAVNVWCERVGFRAVHTFGGRFIPRVE